MKIYSILFLFLQIIGFISARSKRDVEKYGLLSIGLKVLNCDLSRTLNLDVKKINVYFYDFKNGVSKIFAIENAAKNILSLKNLDKSKKFFMFVGGFRSYVNETNSEHVRQAFKKVPNSYLIIIDHSAYTNDKDGKKNSYERSVKYVYYIGKQLAQLLVDLHKSGISPKNIHCIGHSLGAQMLAHTGENFYKATGQKISRITGLDPAGPCFPEKLVNEQIRSGVAQYVEVYHCNAGALGTASILADANFFVNKGKSQPNCKMAFVPSALESSISAICNHRTCVPMWMSSIGHKDWYKAYKCDNHKNFKDGKCSRHETTTAGFWNPGTAKGVYYFSTEGFKFD